MLLEEGVSSLKDDYETWTKILEKTTKGTRAYEAALKILKTDVAKILGTSVEDISDPFMRAAEQTGALTAAATGTKEGVEAL
jgi:hypothetical protein